MNTGPKPMPRNLRVVRGVKDQADVRPGAPIPEPPVHVPATPEYLTEEEAACFSSNARKLARMRVMTDADVDALVIYVRNWLDAQEARRKLAKTGGMIVEAKKTGVPMYNPFLVVARNAEDRCIRILAEFGLTPSSRNRVSQ